MEQDDQNPLNHGNDNQPYQKLKIKKLNFEITALYLIRNDGSPDWLVSCRVEGNRTMSSDGGINEIVEEEDKSLPESH